MDGGIIGEEDDGYCVAYKPNHISMSCSEEDDGYSCMTFEINLTGQYNHSVNY